MIRTQINIYSIRQNKNDANMNKNKKMLEQKNKSEQMMNNPKK